MSCDQLHGNKPTAPENGRRGVGGMVTLSAVEYAEQGDRYRQVLRMLHRTQERQRRTVVGAEIPGTAVVAREYPQPCGCVIVASWYEIEDPISSLWMDA